MCIKVLVECNRVVSLCDCLKSCCSLSRRYLEHKCCSRYTANNRFINFSRGHKLYVNIAAAQQLDEQLTHLFEANVTLKWESSLALNGNLHQYIMTLDLQQSTVYTTGFLQSVKTFFIPPGYGDRFIPRRYHQVIESKTKVVPTSNPYSQSKEDEDTCFDIFHLRLHKSYWRLCNFRKSLIDLFDLEKDQKLLHLHDRPSPSQVPYHSRFDNIGWPCIPRAVPSAFVESTHDLPRFNRNTSINLFAWSPLGVIAAAFNHELVLWAPPSEETVCFVMRNITALSFNSDGLYLATGNLLWKVGNASTSDTTLKLWRVTQNRLRMASGLLVVGAGTLNAIEWHPSEPYLLVGCEVGSIIIFKYNERDLIMVNNITQHEHPVHSLKFSPNYVYVASGGVDGTIIVWKWNDGKLAANFKWRSDDDCTFFDWHPWCNGLLVIAEACGSIAVVQVVGKRIISSYQRDDLKYKISAISFNKLSAELVVSCTFFEKRGKIVHEIIVLSSLSNIVDRVRNHTKSVRLLAWGPNNMYLATPGDDESLTIWNFFAVFNRKLKIRLKEKANKSSKMEWNFGNRLKYAPEIR